MNPLEIQGTVAAVLIVLGALLKRLFPDDTRWVPAALLVIGTPLYASVANEWTVLSLCSGFLSAASAIGLHQAAKQTTGKSL